MKQIIYAMQFKGKAGPGPAANVMKASTSASSTTIASVVSSQGVQGKIEPAAGGKAEFESEVTLTGDTSFLEKGSIRFGDGNRLQFSSIEHGYLGDSVGPEAEIWRRHVACRWRRGAVRRRHRIYHVEFHAQRCR